jgi:putative redox protein
VLDLPLGEPTAYALFAHCFTCGKDIRAAKVIAERLAVCGIAVLRFDFTGLGGSEGEFANSHFSSNVNDLVAAADHLRKTRQAPALLIGHSLGGAAVLAAAHRIEEARAVVTIAAPCDPAHVTGLFKDHVEAIKERGEVEVALAGRPFRIRREFIDDVTEQKLRDCLASLRKALLIFHSPTDDLVGIENASRIFTAAKHPKSFVSLSGADHLLSKKSDARYVANVIAAWAERYLDQPQSVQEPESETGVVTVRETRSGKFQQEIMSGPHRFIADEPVSFGGLDSGPGPYDLLLASLGACTSMTIRLYADRKQLPLERVTVRLTHAKIHAEDCEHCETREGMIDRIDRTIALEGDLDAETRKRLMEIADKCPVHRTLKSENEIRTFEQAS